MNITLNGIKITQDSKNLAFEKNNNVDEIVVTVDTDESWSYKLDVKYPDKFNIKKDTLYNIIDLDRNGNICSAILDSKMLPFNGKYTMQLRGINGDKVYHSDTFEVWVKYSIEPGSTYNPVPSEFYQVEARLDNKVDEAKQYAENAEIASTRMPKISPDNTWLIWDAETGDYVDTGIVASGGTTDHSKLINRSAADQHPMSAITGLEKALESKQPAGAYLTDKDLDTTLKETGKAADAAEVGKRLSSLSEEIVNLSSSTNNASGIELTLEDCINKAPESFLVTGNLISSATDVVPDTFSLTVNGVSIAIASGLFALKNKDGTVFADVLDAVSKTITYRVRKLIFTGAETFIYDQYSCNIFTIENAADYHNSASNYDTTCGAICSHFTLWNYGNITPTGAYKNGCFGLGKDGNKINFGYCPDGETQATPEQLQAYFAEQYAAGTPVTIYYILAAEKTEAVSMPDIVLKEGTNIISNDANFRMNIEYYVTGSSATDTSDCVKNTATVDPENEYWSNFKNFMGRNPSVSPIPEQMMAPLESAGMITANADRWKTGQQGMSTKGELSDSTFVQGGHVFEGWDTEKIWRLTMLIGKFVAGNVHIVAFKPNESGVEEFGIVTIGSDHQWEGLDVAQKYAYMNGNMIASSFSGANNYGSQKYYGGISNADKKTPTGANMEITAVANDTPSRVQFNDCKNGMKIPVLESDPTVLEDGVFWFNSAEGAFKGIVGGEIKVFTLS